MPPTMPPTMPHSIRSLFKRIEFQKNTQFKNYIGKLQHIIKYTIKK